MRVLFAVWPGTAHLNPVIPLAWAFQTAGHEVRIASHHVMSESIISAGLTPVALGDKDVRPMGPGKPYPEAEWEKLERATGALALDPATSDPWGICSIYVMPGVWDFLSPPSEPDRPTPWVDDLMTFSRHWQPDLVLWDPVCPAAAVAAVDCGAAQARLQPWQDHIGWSLDRFAERPVAEVGEHPVIEAVRPVAERYGVEVNTELLYGQWTIDWLPRGFRLPTTARTMPLRPVPFNAPGSVPEWLLEPPERPRVCLTLGLSAREFMPEGVGWEHVPVLLDAVADLDIDVVATLNRGQLFNVESLPDNVRIADYVPLNQLVPTCSAVIHHGAPATFSRPAAHRVPQLVIDLEGPVHERYPGATATARYVNERGAGLTLDIGKPSADEMRKKISRVLDEPSFQKGAERVYEDLLAMPTAGELVPVLERLTLHHRSR